MKLRHLAAMIAIPALLVLLIKGTEHFTGHQVGADNTERVLDDTLQISAGRLQPVDPTDSTVKHDPSK